MVDKHIRSTLEGQKKKEFAEYITEYWTKPRDMIYKRVTENAERSAEYHMGERRHGGDQKRHRLQ